MKRFWNVGKRILTLSLCIAPAAFPQRTQNYRDSQIDGFMSDSKHDQSELRAKVDTLIQLNSQANEHLKYNDARLDEMNANNKWFISILLGALGLSGVNLHTSTKNKEILRGMRGREDARTERDERDERNYQAPSS